MHSVLLGVVKTFFKFWFEGDNSKEYCLNKHTSQINERLLRIKPPSFINNPPRSIYLWKKWKAHEFLYFMLYYILPVFHKIMKHDCYVNITKLVIFLETILAKSIKKSDLLIAQNIINGFLKEVARLYDDSIMLSSLHELVHLADCTLYFGPLNAVNCFQFEELNRKFLRFINF